MGSSGETPQSASVKTRVSYASYDSLNPSEMRVIETAHTVIILLHKTSEYKF